MIRSLALAAGLPSLQSRGNWVCRWGTTRQEAPLIGGKEPKAPRLLVSWARHVIVGCLMKKTFGLRKLTRHLLATTCLTAAAGAASATTVVGPFGSTFASATLLPVGTTEIQDTINTGQGTVTEWVSFSGLEGGGSFSFSATETGPNTGSASARDSSNGDLLDFAIPASGQAGIIPADGILYLIVNFPSCGDCELTNYAVDLTAPLATPTPEPGTLSVAGLTLAGAVALRRKRK